MLILYYTTTYLSIQCITFFDCIINCVFAAAATATEIFFAQSTISQFCEGKCIAPADGITVFSDICLLPGQHDSLP